jgi:hypothetical protein
MDGSRFDTLTRSLSTAGSRRRTLRLLAGSTLGSLLIFGSGPTAAKKGGKKKGDGGKGGKKNDENDKNDKKNEQCGGGKLRCGNDCVNALADPTNCGGCGTKCDVFHSCRNGACLPCPQFTMRCFGSTSNACINIDADPANCGACGITCRKHEVCRGGDCLCTGQTCQDGSCCPSGYACVGQGSACCPTGYYACGNGRCCPNGYRCGGKCGHECCA